MNVNTWTLSADQQVNVDFDVMASEADIAALETKLLMVLGPGFVRPEIKLERLGAKVSRYYVRFPVRGPRRFDLVEVMDWVHSVGLVAKHIEGQDGPIVYPVR